MRRIQLYMNDELDDRLEAEAAERGVSKASLVREAVARFFGSTGDHDPVDDLIGAFDGPADDDESIDSVVYG
jgi:HEAT repeat protein